MLACATRRYAPAPCRGAGSTDRHTTPGSRLAHDDSYTTNSPCWHNHPDHTIAARGCQRRRRWQAEGWQRLRGGAIRVSTAHRSSAAAQHSRPLSSPHSPLPPPGSSRHLHCLPPQSHPPPPPSGFVAPISSASTHPAVGAAHLALGSWVKGRGWLVGQQRREWQR